MKQIKNAILWLCFLLLATHSLLAQQQTGAGHVTLLKKNGQAKTADASGIGHVTLLKRNALLIYIGGGSESPSSDVKDVAHLNNFLSISEEIYKPLWVRRNFSVGLNIAGHYLLTNSDQLATVPEPYHISGETSSSVAVERRGNPSAQGFKLGFGPQLNFHFGNRFIVSPIFNVGYMNITQKALSAVQTSEVNTVIYKYNLLNQTETKTDGMALIPKIRLHYFFTKWLGIWAEAAYTVGPSINTVTTTFAPAGEPFIETNDYELQAMELGTYNETKTETKYSAIGIHAGLVFAIGGSHKEPEVTPVIETTNYVGHVTLLKKNGLAVISQDELNGNQHPQESCRPIILSPAAGSKLNTGVKNNLEVRFPDNYTGNKNIRIYKISDDEKYLETLKPEAQKALLSRAESTGNVSNAIEQSMKDKKPMKIDASKNAIEKNALTPGTYLAFVGDDFCGSNPVVFRMSSTCTPTPVPVIVSANCNDQGSINVTGKIDFNYMAADPSNPLNNHDINITNVTITGVEDQAQNPVATNLVFPKVISTATADQYAFDFMVNQSMCNKILYVKFTYSYTCQSSNGSIETNGPIVCSVAKEMPCCNCTYCDELQWAFAENDTTVYDYGSNTINVSSGISSPNVTIKSFKAEIISYVQNGKPECMANNKNSQTFGDFTTGSFASWGNGFFPLGGSKTTSHTLNWFGVPGSTIAIGGTPKPINLSISTPPLNALDCCDDTIQFCIRYSFTDKDCRTCSFVKCYTVERQHLTKD